MNARILLLATVLLLAIQAWGQNNQLIGSWRINMDKTLAIMNSDARKQYDTLSIELQSRAVNAMKDREFILEGSGHISVKWLSRNGPKTSSGRWATDLSENILRITIRMPIRACPEKVFLGHTVYCSSF